MKTKTGILILTAMVGWAATASAEEVSGRVSNVNLGDGSVRILRSDTKDYFSVNVKDRSQLNSLRNGSMVSFQANQASGGAWEANTFRPMSATSSTARPTGASPAPASASTNSSLGTSNRVLTSEASKTSLPKSTMGTNTNAGASTAPATGNSAGTVSATTPDLS